MRGFFMGNCLNLSPFKVCLAFFNKGIHTFFLILCDLRRVRLHDCESLKSAIKSVLILEVALSLSLDSFEGVEPLMLE